jgi:hypothetical protein
MAMVPATPAKSAIQRRSRFRQGIPRFTFCTSSDITHPPLEQALSIGHACASV